MGSSDTVTCVGSVNSPCPVSSVDSMGSSDTVSCVGSVNSPCPVSSVDSMGSSDTVTCVGSVDSVSRYDNEGMNSAAVTAIATTMNLVLKL